MPPVKQARTTKRRLDSLTAKADRAQESIDHRNKDHNDLLLPAEPSGLLEAETDLERTWRVSQNDILDNAPIGVQDKRFSLDLPGSGPYKFDYTRNGRYLVLGGHSGHMADFDWFTSKLHSEIDVNETVKCVRWLHDDSFYAAAQEKYVYIYDKGGAEVHELRNLFGVNAMSFLPHHFLLATIGQTGYLKYQDTSTGQLVSEIRTKLGTCDQLTVNPYNAIVHLGHQNGTVTLWSPSVSHAQVTLLAHKGPVKGIAIDPTSHGRRMATSGVDGLIKIWDMRMWDVIDTAKVPRTVRSLDYSQSGLLGVGWGTHAYVYKPRGADAHPDKPQQAPYMSQRLPGLVQQVQFCPFEDVLGVGHQEGFTSVVIPGAGESHLDTLVADPFETKRRRREREVHALLDKIPADMITLDPDVVGRLRTNDGRPLARNADQLPTTELSKSEQARRAKQRAKRYRRKNIIIDQ